jgi:hypothetical protein
MLHPQADQSRRRRDLSARQLHHRTPPLLNRFRLRYSPFVNGSSRIFGRPADRQETKLVSYV